MSQAPRDARWNVALLGALISEGFIEEKNLVVEAHGFGLRVDEVAERAATMVKARIDVFVCGGESAIRAAQQATKTIPIAGVADDMLKSGFVASLAKPDGNTTGVSILATELDSKRQEVLLYAVPGVRRVATLADANTTLPQQLHTLEETARARGVDSSIYGIKKPEEIVGAIDAAKNSGAQALNVLASAMLYNARQLILPRVAARGLPTIYQWP
jgi:putative ABC transport system substrate-binding protein